MTMYMTRNVKSSLNTKLYEIYQISILLVLISNIEKKITTLYSFDISDHSDLVIYTSILDSPTNYERVNSKVYKYFR